MTDSILPCPFCNGTPKLEDHRLCWSVQCESCGGCIVGDRAPEPETEMSDAYWQGLEDSAVAKWNTRAQPASEPKPAQWQYLSRDPVYPRWINIDESDSVKAERDGFEVRKLFTRPAPAGVVLPPHKVRDEYGYLLHDDKVYNACLDAVAKLNGSPK